MQSIDVEAQLLAGTITTRMAQQSRVDFEGDDLASLGSSVCFFALWGGVAGWVGRLLTRAEQEVATTRARDEVAATLHDGVLRSSSADATALRSTGHPSVLRPR